MTTYHITPLLSISDGLEGDPDWMAPERAIDEITIGEPATVCIGDAAAVLRALGMTDREIADRIFFAITGRLQPTS
jgi:hypothetical protein